MRVLVCGDRNWTNQAIILRELHTVEDEFDEYITVVIHGDARGADTLAGLAARQMCGYEHPKEQVDDNTPKLEVYPAQWDKFGRAAGPIRNQQMLDEGKPDLVLAFHADIENSKGTKDMVNRARKAGIPVKVFGV